jgi:phosphoglycerate dehydrogenase-like enzyme
MTLHVPKTAETHRMIDSRVLASVRPGTILLNTSRGSVLDLDAVFAALRGGRLEAFAADVLPDEPPDPEHPLLRAYAAAEEWQLGRVVLTPHAAFYSEQAELELRQRAARAMRDAVTGRTLANCVNLADLVSARVLVAGYR